MKINNTVALVTGANRGIGLEFTRQLLARGARKVYGGALVGQWWLPRGVCSQQGRCLVADKLAALMPNSSRAVRQS
jgi:NAD(P)-dependent dehydrogenase (short-subunit alcohol dehydrogenase family)